MIKDYKILKKCRLCFSKKIYNFLDFGLFPLAGSFLKKKAIPKEKLYPLKVQYCLNCSNVQINTVISIKKLFNNYFYFSSKIKTLVEHFYDFKEILKRNFLLNNKSFVVEIGCNDGVFLQHLHNDKIRYLGVDPATNIVKSVKNLNLNILNKPFTAEICRYILKKYDYADLIISSFSFAHIDDMHDVMNGVNLLLKREGVFIFEIYYLGFIIKEKQYDMIYHEHMSYYSIKSLKLFLKIYDMEIFKIESLKLRSGSLRFYVKRKKNNNYELDNSVNKFIKIEKKDKLTSLSCYKNYGFYIDKCKNDLITILKNLKKSNKKIVGYGASGRATTIMNYCKIGKIYLDYVIDDAPAKKGLYTPGTHLKITNWDYLEKEQKKPDYILLFAWPFLNEVLKKRKSFLEKGGKFIIPLPKVRIIGK